LAVQTNGASSVPRACSRDNAIASAIYEGATNTLYVAFTDEIEASYSNLPLSVAMGLATSTSKGR